MNLSMLLEMATDAVPDRIAVTCGGTNLTYAELLSASRKAAGLFQASGCAYVSILMTNHPAVPIALMGAAIAGVPFVPLNYRLADEQLKALIDRIEPAFLIADDAERAKSLGAQNAQNVDAFLAALETAEEAEAGLPTEIAIQLFTSGTTGAPKAALLKHENLTSYILETVEFMGADEDQSGLTSVPPYHIAGISAVLSSIYSCRRIVQLPNFSPTDWLHEMAVNKVTNAFVVPTMLSRIVEEIEKQPDQWDLSNLQAIAYGGGKMPLPVIEKAITFFPGVNFTNAYGLTETSSTIAILTPDDHEAAMASDDKAVRARLASVGKPIPSIELEVRDDEDNVLGPNEPGEIFVRGPQVSGEYKEKSALTADGWFPTRDAGFLDEEGYLFLSGRADDVIVRGGENISPSEIEDLLIGQNLVSDVAAVAIPSQEWGETIGLAVVRKDDASLGKDDISQIIKQNLRSSRVPEKYLFKDELPYSETGKLLRRVVKTWFEE